MPSTATTTDAARRRAALAGPIRGRERLIVAPGVYDGFTTMVAVRHDFPALYIGGYCAAASRWGLPDAGLVGLSEMLDTIDVVARVADRPVIADADTGYGGLLNVRHTVREYEARGVAAIQIEDQEMPKKCGHTRGKRVVPASEMAAKVEVAVAARRHDDTLIIARTDARATDGLDAAIERCRLYHRAGADVCFVDAPESVDELRRIAAGVDAPLMVNMVPPQPGFLGLDAAVDELREIGFSLAIYPGALASPALAAMHASLRELATTGRQPAPAPVTAAPSEGGSSHDLTGFAEVWALEAAWNARYADPAWVERLP